MSNKQAVKALNPRAAQVLKTIGTDWFEAGGTRAVNNPTGQTIGTSSYEYTTRKVWPPDFKLTPNGKYTLMAYGDRIGILDQSNTHYQNTLKYFKEIGPGKYSDFKAEVTTTTTNPSGNSVTRNYSE